MFEDSIVMLIFVRVLSFKTLLTIKIWSRSYGLRRSHPYYGHGHSHIANNTAGSSGNVVSTCISQDTTYGLEARLDPVYPLYCSIYDERNSFNPTSHSTTTDASTTSDIINTLSTWDVDKDNVTLNGSKCKCMTISRLKRNSVVASVPVLTLHNKPIEKVSSYKYLGVIIMNDLLWSIHIERIRSKVKKIIGLIYHQFYSWSSQQTLLRLYISLVRPHLEYAMQVWNPHLTKDIQKSENVVQKFALKVCCKQWDLTYAEALDQTALPDLKARRTHLNLCYFYKLINGLFEFPNSPLTTRQLNYPTRSGKTNLYYQPYTHSNSFLFRISFFPQTISLWNSLPFSIASARTFNCFKYLLLSHII
jgi:hypothetical protein